MRLSAHPDDSRAARASAAVVPVVEDDEDERGAWGEGSTYLVYRSRLPPRHTLTLDVTPEALLYRHTLYPPCAYRWRDIVRTSPAENPISGAWFILSLWPPVDAPSAVEAAPPPSVIPPGVVPPGWEEVRLPGTRAVVDLVNLVNRHTPHLPYLWLPDPSAYGGYAQHDRSCTLAPDWGRDPRTRVARWFRAYRWDPR